MLALKRWIFLVVILLLLYGCTTTTTVEPLVQTGTITGRISNREYAAIENKKAGFTVQLVDEKAQIARSFITDTSGRYQFDSIETGTYEIRATKDGYSTTRQQQIQFVAPGTLIIPSTIIVWAMPPFGLIDPHLDTASRTDGMIGFTVSTTNVPTRLSGTPLQVLVTIYTADPAKSSSVDSAQYPLSSDPLSTTDTIHLITVDTGFIAKEFPKHQGTLFARFQPFSGISYIDVYTKTIYFAVNELTPLVEFTIPR